MTAFTISGIAASIEGVTGGRGGGAASALRRDPAPNRPLARAARGGGLTGASDEAGGAEGRTMCAEIGQRYPSGPDQPADRDLVALSTWLLPSDERSD